MSEHQQSLPASGDTRHNYGTSPLAARLSVDLASGLVAGLTVAPIVSVIDRAVTESVSGRTALLLSVRRSLTGMVARPHHFIRSRPFLIMLLLYGSTYLSANLTDTVSSLLHGQSASTTTSGLAKFLVTSTVNLNLSLYKDMQYARMFGTGRPSVFPPASYAIFIIRDCMTIFGSFNLPHLIAPVLPSGTETVLNRLTAAQLASPMLMQIFGTPLHLFGLDLYNRKGRIALRDRLNKVKVDWPKTTLARMCRVLPAFGLGGVVNTSLRTSLMNRIE